MSLKNYLDSDDLTWSAVNPAIWTQVALNLSLLTACVPSLKGVLDMFKSGTSLFQLPAQYGTTMSGSGSYGLRSRLTSAIANRFTSNKSANASQIDEQSSRSEWPTKQMKKVSGQHSTVVSNPGKGSNLNRIPERSESQRSLTENVILRTVDYEVEYEDKKNSQTVRGSDNQSHSSVDHDERSIRAIGR